MAKKNIGATLSIKDNNFTAGIKKAITGTKDLKTHTANATGSLKKMGSQSKSTGTSLASLAKRSPVLLRHMPVSDRLFSLERTV